MDSLRKIWANLVNRIIRVSSRYCQRHGGRGNGFRCPGCREMKSLAMEARNLICLTPEDSNNAEVDWDEQTFGKDDAEAMVEPSISQVPLRYYKPGAKNNKNRVVPLSLILSIDDDDESCQEK